MNDTRRRPHWRPAYIGVGSNLDSPRDQVRRALDAIAALDGCRVVRSSSLYRSAPVGPQDQPDFVNAVVAVLTTRDARELLADLQSIERSQGRVRGGERWGPRTLDLDLLVFGSARIDEPGLTVPHPRIAERNFVLLPLEELAPDLMIPGLGTVSAVTAKNDNSVPTIERIQTSDPCR